MNSISCLKDGFVQLIDWMPKSDDPREIESAIVHAARVSTVSDIQKQVKSEKDDKALIRYLYRNKHTSPFEMITFKFYIKCPLFIARQWMRHRTGSYNEHSARYSEFPDEYYDPTIITKEMCPGGGIRFQDNSLTGNKQGSSSDSKEITPEIKDKFARMNQYIDMIFANYHSLLKDGISKEVARYALPVATYSQMYFCMDLHNLLHFLKLRMDHHAQPEIQVYAKAIYDLISPLVPTVIDCFNNFSLNAITLSETEIRALNRRNPSLIENARERKEFQDKLKLLGIDL